jgi:hypothetical protein
MAQAIEVERYISAFEAWARVTKASDGVRAHLAECSLFLREQFHGSVEIEALCTAGIGWYRSRNRYHPDVGKSCLMGRMVYGGEELRERPCPIHGGRWSGCAPEACPAGCSYGINITGWLPNDQVDEWPARAPDAKLDALADALRESWTDDHLAIYADRLIALGDPRGELISVELAMRSDSAPALASRHAALVTACFGDLRSTAIDEFRSTRGVGERAAVHRGFLELAIEAAYDVRKLFNARNGRYLRSIEIRGDSPTVRTSLLMLSIRPLKWLDSISATVQPRSRHDATLEADDAESLFSAAPNLTTLAVDGRRVLAVTELPVRRLRLSELDSIAFETAPQLAELELAPTQRLDIDELSRFLLALDRRAPALARITVPRQMLPGHVQHPKLAIT